MKGDSQQQELYAPLDLSASFCENINKRIIYYIEKKYYPLVYTIQTLISSTPDLNSYEVWNRVYDWKLIIYIIYNDYIIAVFLNYIQVH